MLILHLFLNLSNKVLLPHYSNLNHLIGERNLLFLCDKHLPKMKKNINQQNYIPKYSHSIRHVHKYIHILTSHDFF